NPGLVARRSLYAFERELAHDFRLDNAHGSELRERVLAHEAIDAPDLLVGQARIRFREGHQRTGVPHAEGVTRVEARACPLPALRIHEHAIACIRRALPLPPWSAHATDAVRRVTALEHHAFDGERAALI